MDRYPNQVEADANGFAESVGEMLPSVCNDDGEDDKKIEENQVEEYQLYYQVLTQESLQH